MPNVRLLLALAIASTWLAGCPAPPGPVASPGPTAGAAVSGPAGIMGHNGGQLAPATGAPVAMAKPPASTLTPQAKADASALGKSVSEGAADERAMADYDMILDDGSGIVAAGGGNMVAAGGGNMVAAGGLNFALLQTADDEREGPLLSPSLAALANTELRGKLRERRARIGAKARARLAARPDRAKLAEALAAAKATTNADGTRTIRLTVDLPWKNFTRKTLVHATLSADNQLLHSYVAYLRPRKLRPRQLFHYVWRETSLQADGSHVVRYFQSVFVKKLGARRVTRWEKTIAADGAVSGSGTVRWHKPPRGPHGREVLLSFGGHEETGETIATTDPAAKLKAILAIAPDATGHRASVEVEGATAEVDLEQVPAEVEPSDPNQPDEDI